MTKKEYKEANELALKLCTDDFYFTSQDDEGIFTSRYFTMKDHDKKKIVETAKAICKRERTKLINVIDYIDSECGAMPVILYMDADARLDMGTRKGNVDFLKNFLKENGII